MVEYYKCVTNENMFESFYVIFNVFFFFQDADRYVFLTLNEVILNVNALVFMLLFFKAKYCHRDLVFTNLLSEILDGKLG